MAHGLTVATVTAMSFALFSILAVISRARSRSWLLWAPHFGLGTIMLAAMWGPAGSSLTWVSTLIVFVGLVVVAFLIRLGWAGARMPISFGRFRPLLFGIDAGFMILMMTLMPTQAMNSHSEMSGVLGGEMGGHRALILPSNLILPIVLFIWAALSTLIISKLVARHPSAPSWRNGVADAACSGCMIISMTAMIL